jgi:hypothetical protein
MFNSYAALKSSRQMHVLNKHDDFVGLPMTFRIPRNENKFGDGDSVISPSHLQTRNRSINITDIINELFIWDTLSTQYGC